MLDNFTPNITDIDQIENISGHTLFVEGKKDFDSTVLQHLLIDIHITIQKLGSCSHINAAADALYSCHKKYYFLIDRDYRTIEKVEESWKNFPNTETENLLIWRKKELENYFIDPEYLAQSRNIKPNCSIETIKDLIRNTAKERLYYDVAKTIISEINPCKKQDFALSTDKNETFEILFNTMLKMHNNCTIPDKNELSNQFESILNDYTGGSETLEYGEGNWLNLISGKEIFNEVIGQYFHVKGDNNKIKQGEEAKKEIVKDLLKKGLDNQPDDFKELVKIIKKRVNVS